MDTYAPERKLGNHHHGIKSRALRMVEIERARQECPGVHTLFFSDSEPVSAGQFYMVWIPGKGEVPLSASVISPLDRRAVTVADVGERTSALNKMEQGDLIGIRGPFGNGFRVEDDWLWIGGGVGTAPIVAALSTILDADLNATIVMGAARADALILLEKARHLFTGEGEGLDAVSAPPTLPECAPGEGGGNRGSSAGIGGAGAAAGPGGAMVESGDGGQGGDGGDGGYGGKEGHGDGDGELIDLPPPCAPAIFNDKVSLHICTDDGSTGYKGLASQMAHALIMERKGKGMGIFQGMAACGPEPMMLTVLELANLYSLKCQLSVERYMKCGVGICDACSMDGLQVCRDGPVFQGEVVNQLYEFGLFSRDSSGRRVSVPNVRHKTQGK